MPATVSRQDLLDSGADHRFRQLIYDLGRLGEIVAATRRHLAAELGLSPAQYSILMLVAEHGADAGVSIVEVADRLHVSGAFITSQVNHLVAAGLLEKTADPRDGRRVLLRLMPEAEAAIATVAPKLRDLNDRFFGEITRTGFETLADVTALLIRTGERALVEATAGRDRLPAGARRSLLRRRR